MISSQLMRNSNRRLNWELYTEINFQPLIWFTVVEALMLLQLRPTILNQVLPFECKITTISNLGLELHSSKFHQNMASCSYQCTQSHGSLSKYSKGSKILLCRLFLQFMLSFHLTSSHVNKQCAVCFFMCAQLSTLRYKRCIQ